MSWIITASAVIVALEHVLQVADRVISGIRDFQESREHKQQGEIWTQARKLAEQLVSTRAAEPLPKVADHG